LVLLAALAAFAGLAVAAGSAAGDVSEFGLRSAEASLSDTQAGGHGDLTTTFSFKGDPGEADAFGNPKPFAEARDVEVQLPPGFVANLAGFTPCPLGQFSTELVGDSGEQGPGECGAASQIGVVHFSLYAGVQNAIASLYELEAPQGTGDVARFGFWATIAPVVIDVRVDSRRGYAATATAEGLTAARTVLPTTVATTIWGDPTSASHDGERPTAFEGAHCGGSCGEPREAGKSPTAFARSSTDCAAGEVGFATDSYQVPGVFDTARVPLPLTTGCGLVPFAPSLFSLQPTSHAAGSSSGVDFNLTLPQKGLTTPGEVSTSDLKKAVVRLPAGVGLNASTVEGLGSCSESEMGLVSEAPPVFDGSEPSCPESSKVGSVTIATPILSEPLNGSLYVAKQGDNPFHSLLAGYLVAKANGIVLKLAGKFELSPSGRITAVFDDNPQAPFSDMELHLKGGPHGVITMPSRCGTYQTEYELTPWSGNAPATGVSSFTVDKNCGSGFAPGFQAGASNPVAGAYSPFTVRLTREAGAPQLVGLDVSPPEGLVAKLAGIPRCSNAAIASIPAASGSGTSEIASPSCPAASRVGSVVAGAGSGTPFFVDTGKVYLAGPYKGAPLSLAVVTPAVAGPFDLGNVVVRVALNIDPETARVTAVSDALPTFVQGVPLDLRDVRVSIDREGFAQNPTSCREMKVNAAITADSGAVATPSARFQMGACAELGFAPKLSVRLFGKTNRGAHPRLKAVLRARSGDANVGRAQVTLPASEFVENAHFNNICTRVDFAAQRCPAGSVYGHAVARSPLFDFPLEGPVYLRSAPGSKSGLPDLVAALKGPASTPIEIDVVGHIDSVNHRLRTTFASVPDAPVSSFVLQMQGKKKGLIVNSEGLCSSTRRLTGRFTAQNGRTVTLRPAVLSGCGKRR
jgi:hypothetical protein